ALAGSNLIQIDALEADHRRTELDTVGDPRDSGVARPDDGAVVRARRVVLAGNPRVPRIPDGVELGAAVVGLEGIDLDQVRPGQRIAVVGAGQTAGQLALRATQRGAVVTVVARGPQRVADLDVDAGWLMDDHLVPLRAVRDPVERRLIVEAAQCGSMTADVDRDLRRLRVTRVCEVGGIEARDDAPGAVIRFVGVECRVDRVWVATGSMPDLRASAPLAAVAEAGAPHVGGWPVLDERLQWCDGLVVVGALAALTLGPAAGNLGGARAAADILAAHPPRRVDG
ncbi:MAG: hypothetical protein AAGE98_09000, partial [Actinomycetota bacterium]